MNRIVLVALALAGAALLSGCPKKHNINDAPVAGTQVPDSAGANAEGASTSTTALDGDAGKLVRGNRRQPIDRPLQLATRDRRGLHADQHLARIRRRRLDLLDLQAVIVQPYR